MEVLLPLLALLGVLGTDPPADVSRQAALYTVLERAEMLHEASRRQHDPDRVTRASATDRDVTRELLYTELDSGFLARTCVHDDATVTRMRMMIAYVGVLRMVGESDTVIETRLVGAAGADGEQLRQLIGFAGLDGIAHFICADFMGEALASGMPANDLREYIDELTPVPASPLPPARELRLASRQ